MHHAFMRLADSNISYNFASNFKLLYVCKTAKYLRMFFVFERCKSITGFTIF
jgi:hypothetical protein